MKFKTKVVSIKNGIIEVESTLEERQAIIDKSYGEYCCNRACIVQIRDVLVGLFCSTIKVQLSADKMIFKSNTDLEKNFDLRVEDEIIIVI